MNHPADRVERFWKFVDKTSGCWLWTGTRSAFGHGSFSIGRRNLKAKAHRFSYEIHVGPIPDGLHVLHRCDNPPCVNPDHLFVGTDADNVADCIAKGRKHRGPRRSRYAPKPQGPGIQRGEACRHSKLTEADVVFIRSQPKETVSSRSLASRFNVSAPTIQDARRGKTWAHVPNGAPDASSAAARHFSEERVAS